MQNNEDKIKVLEYQDYNIIENSEDPPPPYSAVAHIDPKVSSFLFRLDLQAWVNILPRNPYFYSIGIWSVF